MKRLTAIHLNITCRATQHRAWGHINCCHSGHIQLCFTRLHCHANTRSRPLILDVHAGWANAGGEGVGPTLGFQRGSPTMRGGNRPPCGHLRRHSEAPLQTNMRQRQAGVDSHNGTATCPEQWWHPHAWQSLNLVRDKGCDSINHKCRLRSGTPSRQHNLDCSTIVRRRPKEILFQLRPWFCVSPALLTTRQHSNAKYCDGWILLQYYVACVPRCGGMHRHAQRQLTSRERQIAPQREGGRPASVAYHSQVERADRANIDSPDRGYVGFGGLKNKNALRLAARDDRAESVRQSQVNHRKDRRYQGHRIRWPANRLLRGIPSPLTGVCARLGRSENGGAVASTIDDRGARTSGRFHCCTLYGKRSQWHLSWQ